MSPFSSSKPVHCPPPRPNPAHSSKEKPSQEKLRQRSPSCLISVFLILPVLQLTGCFPQNEPEPKALNWPTRGESEGASGGTLNQSAVRLCPQPASIQLFHLHINFCFFTIFDHNHHLLLQHIGCTLESNPPPPQAHKRKIENKGS